MRIVVLDGHTENPGDLSWEGFEGIGELTVYDRTPFDGAEICKRIGGAEIVLTNKTPISEETLETCKNIKYIGILATGYNIVDVEAAKARGIPVANVPTYGTAAVAQLVFAHLLAYCHHVSEHSSAVFAGDWTRCPDYSFWNYPLIELADKTMGIIGLGRIGQAAARIAKALGMNVLAYDDMQTDSGRECATYVSLDELLAASDVISLHCPLLPSTEGIINKSSIAKMKRGVVLINTSRGPLVAEQDLLDALESGHIAHAGIDVVSAEPIKADNVLLKAKNCFITPHIAWAPLEARRRLMEIAVKNLEAFIAGEPVNVVNA